MIAIEKLTKAYDGRTVIDGLSLSFAKGETTCLVGPSGCGKTTLLRCLNGLETFDAGSIRVGEHRLAPGPTPPDLLRRVRIKLGFVFQQWHLFAHRNAVGNVTEAPIHVLGLAPAEAERRAHELLERVGLAHRAKAYPRSLSGGEQQRVAIARALAMQPDALLMDEPTSALDPERVKSLAQLLGGLAADGITILCVTHDIPFARMFARRVISLDHGRVVSDGPPEQALAGVKE